MDPLLPVDTEVMERDADKDARRKIQFSVPSSVPTQLDPRQVEMVSVRVCRDCVCAYIYNDDSGCCGVCATMRSNPGHIKPVSVYLCHFCAA